ncbi:MULTISPECIES: hypothetical protein [Streptomycetaceae]|uniref:Secreted protein n=1 Tax=Streptantibioticus cattleyicolor (strain ATCC 35852 / DSM 46488 / JCM 4925 / NBRC 14057 / NRRL 8057) TaxID=1003195 RepID=F8JXZ7_STREN|nr:MULTISPECIES: hypothetical protein [Streptomycetaceae]AEW93379.1 hypothetical protein SCATT_10080 [Streptantibioticus cattleyicolor NRRL 8057 = DSM 46488]MYS58093.1 hypothetical protein [Streptomyces sp. SID5468]CCB73734.1 conserved exported protein of unknown function [Streptantibioticus cattleyicolor NRRL 8057 = DSM 46488]
MRTGTRPRPARTRDWPTAVALAVAVLAVAPTAVSAAEPPAPAPAGTECFTRVRGSSARAVCHNPDPETVRAQLHIACRRWWDPAVDTGHAQILPAATVTLGGHCWKEIRAAWVTVR